MSAGPGRLVVVDGSALVALLADAGPAGAWVTAAIDGAVLAAPHLALFEAANILRRHGRSGQLVPAHATLAHADLLALPVELWPYAPLAERAWELRADLTAYNAAYVALAELLHAPLVTLDARLARATGPRCPVEAYPPGGS